MKFIADLHLHSPYSRAVSREMTFENMALWAKKKGLKVLATSDFTHPRWMAEIEDKLEPAEAGLYKLKDQESSARFMLGTEISSIYSRGGRARRIHNLVFTPDIETAKKFISELSQRGGNLLSDGRPIIGLGAEELLRLVKDIDERAVVVPAHAWTPWFSVFGSMSGFDSLEECFGDEAKHIFAIETGLSSDPGMNWRLSKLDNISFISNSDSHSLPRLGREANVFDAELNYDSIWRAVRTRNPQEFLMTIEFFPEEGKYHFDGHRLCGKSLSPEETKELAGKCPVCGREVTVGVLNRVNALADRAEGYSDPLKIPYKKLVPLDEIIAEALEVGVSSKKVKEEYERLTSTFSNEIEILMEKSEAELSKLTTPRIAEGIIKVRKGEIEAVPGYDGEYGKIKIFSPEKSRTTLF
jgi:uncharacterized protein (TIGR00375 family)